MALRPERNDPNEASVMSELKLGALDEEDLKIISAHVQDAVLKVWRHDL